MTDRAALLDAGRAYLERWSTWLKDHPNADETAVTLAMQRGDPPPDTKEPQADETAVNAWEVSHPTAYRIYWTLRAAMQEQDGKSKPVHHRAAILAIHDNFGSKAERERLALPGTVNELAAALGCSDRALRNARETYAAVFSTTRETVRSAFISGYYGRVYEALGETAVMVGREGTQDRKLFVQLAGDLVERTDVTTQGGAISYITENRPAPLPDSEDD